MSYPGACRDPERSPERNQLALPKHAPTGERGPKALDPAPVDAQVGVTQTRGRSDRDDLLGGSKLKLEVIDEAEELSLIHI